MVADAEGARRWANWAAERQQPGWIGWLGNIALLLAAVGVGVGILYAARSSPAPMSPATAMHDDRAGRRSPGSPPLPRAGCTRALAGRVDILSQALDASPDAQLDPRARTAASPTPIPHSTISSRNLGDAPLTRIAEALADADSSADFARLRSQAATGTRAIAALPLRDARGGAAGWFNIEVNPIAGRPGYSFWNLQDITARHEMEAVIRDERNKLVDFLDDAPIGFYSVDGDGRFLFVNQTLAHWLGSTPGGDRRQRRAAARFPRRRRRRRGTPALDPFGGSGEGGAARRGRAAAAATGRILHAWIGQSIVGVRRRAAHPLGRARPDAGARVGRRRSACRASASSASSPTRRSASR